MTALATERMHLPGLLVWLAQRQASDAVADFAADGLNHKPSLDFSIRYTRSSRMQPLVSLHGAVDLPVDASAHWTGLARLLAGLAFRSWTPHVAFEVGSGQGMLVNRHEIRLSAGVRHASP